MRTKKTDQFEEIFSAEMFHGELTHWKLHWVLYSLVLILSMVVFYVQKIESGKFGILLSLINLAYNAGLTYFIIRKKTVIWMSYVTVFINIASLTVYNYLDAYFNSPLVPVTTATLMLFPVIIFLASLRMDKYLILWATFLSIVAMDGMYFWFYPQFDPAISQQLVSADILGQIYRTLYLAICGILMYSVPISMRRILMAQEKLARESQLHKYAAERDTLTGVANRHYFQQYLAKCISSLHLTKRHLALFYIDLDGFKAMNDTYGHDAGDFLLQSIAEDIQETIRPGDLVARIGGDEFVVVAQDTENHQECEILGNRILTVLTKTRQYTGYPLTIGASIGIALYPDDAKDMDTLIKQADEAMYRVKRSSKNSVMLWSQQE